MIPALAFVAMLNPFADPVASCGQDIGQVVESIEEQGGHLIDLIEVNGIGFDQLIIADLRGEIVVGGFLKNCSVGAPLPLGASRELIGA